MIGSLALQSPVKKYSTARFGIRKSKKQKVMKKKNKTASRQRYFSLPDNDELTTTEMLLIMQYRFFRG